LGSEAGVSHCRETRCGVACVDFPSKVSGAQNSGYDARCLASRIGAKVLNLKGGFSARRRGKRRDQANSRARCSSHDAARGQAFLSRSGVRDTGCLPSMMASTISGARKARLIFRLT